MNFTTGVEQTLPRCGGPPGQALTRGRRCSTLGAHAGGPARRGAAARGYRLCARPARRTHRTTAHGTARSRRAVLPFPPASAPQAPAVSPDAERPPATCVPGCRSGFVCVAGTCVSACNPPCPAGQECTQGNRCAADASALKQALKAAITEYDEEQRAKYRAKSVRRHDGGYLRLGFNAGYAWDSAERGDVSTESRGAGGFLEYAFGANVSEHAVLGFGHHTFGVFSPNTEVGGAELEADHSAFYQILGLFLDYYLDPAAGWHVTATLGPGIANVQVLDGEETDAGIGLALGAGYDFWIGEQWSLGAGARLLYISGAADDFGDHRAVIPTLNFSALWH